MDYTDFEKAIKARTRLAILVLNGNKMQINPFLKAKMLNCFKINNGVISFAEVVLVDFNYKKNGREDLWGNTYDFKFASAIFLMFGYEVTEKLLIEKVINREDAHPLDNKTWYMERVLPSGKTGGFAIVKKELVRLLVTIYAMILEEDNCLDKLPEKITKWFAMKEELSFYGSLNKNGTPFHFSYKSVFIYEFEQTIIWNLYCMYHTIENLENEINRQIKESSKIFKC